MRYGCAECGKEILHTNLLLVERIKLDEDNDTEETALCITHTHPCTFPFVIAMYPIHRGALRRLFPSSDTLSLPWPAAIEVRTGIMLDEPTIKIDTEKIMALAKWELEQTEGAWDALLFMNRPRRGEEPPTAKG